jgi:hypothetical protein
MAYTTSPATARHRDTSSGGSARRGGRHGLTVCHRRYSSYALACSLESAVRCQVRTVAGQAPCGRGHHDPLRGAYSRTRHPVEGAWAGRIPHPAFLAYLCREAVPRAVVGLPLRLARTPDRDDGCAVEYGGGCPALPRWGRDGDIHNAGACYARNACRPRWGVTRLMSYRLYHRRFLRMKISVSP